MKQFLNSRILLFKSIPLLFLILLLSCGKSDEPFNYFPEVGENAIQQRALYLKSNLVVLSIALEPGLEDLEALAYFRLGRGAKIVSAYFTNGEAGESDAGTEYPTHLAAERRNEAEEALERLDGDVHFLNFPHILAARDSSVVRKKWPKAQVRKKLIDLVNNYQPDIILVANDRIENKSSLMWSVFKDDVIRTVAKMPEETSTGNGGSNWLVSRILGHDPEQAGTRLPVNEKHPEFGFTYSEIGAEAAKAYQSLRIQRQGWQKNNNPEYSSFHSISEVFEGQPLSNLPQRYSSRLREIADRIDQISSEATKKDGESTLTEIVSTLDTLTSCIGRRFEFPKNDVRALFHWKKSLEALRCSLLGVEVKYNVSEDILTMLQLDYVTVEEVTGTTEEGETSVFFGGLDQKWIINEGFDKRFKYHPGDIYRLLSPEELNLTVPHSVRGLDAAKLGKQVTLHVIHESPEKEKSFLYSSSFILRFAPKFTAEPLTPIVRISSNEELVVRLTNHSRDGVRDTMRVDDEMGESMPSLFRLSEKNATYVDTLFLIWKGSPANGTYLIPIEISDIKVGEFAARKFDVSVRDGRKIGLLTTHKNSILPPSMRRLGLEHIEVDPDRGLSNQIQDLDVLIVDRRALTFKPKIGDDKAELEEFANKGGHLIYLSQNAREWDDSNLISGIVLSPSQKFDERIPVEMDAGHPFVQTPNQLGPTDWDEWLFLRAHNKVEIQDGMNVEIPIKTAGNNEPLIVTRPVGQGRITYVDLALSVQLMNINPGAFRLLANLISN